MASIPIAPWRDPEWFHGEWLHGETVAPRRVAPEQGEACPENQLIGGASNTIGGGLDAVKAACRATSDCAGFTMYNEHQPPNGVLCNDTSNLVGYPSANVYGPK